MMDLTKKTGTYYQVFSPEDITKDKTVYDAAKKLEKDFRGLYKNWNDTCKIKKYFFVINDKYEGIDPVITKKVLELRCEKDFSDIDIDIFLAKDLQKVFEGLDEDDILDIIGFIPGCSHEMIEYSTLSEVIDYLMKTELPESKNDKLKVPDFDEKINLNVNGKVGDKVNMNLNYNTDATFDFDAQNMKLKYDGKEDEIIKLVEAGNELV